MDKFRFNKRYGNSNNELDKIENSNHPKLDDFEDLLRKIKARKLEPIPRRVKEAESFVSMIMEFCDLFEYDMEISRSEDEISAIMKINVLVLSGYCKDYFNRILTMADEINIHPNPQNENLLIIRYYTHEVYFNGKKTRNIE